MRKTSTYVLILSLCLPLVSLAENWSKEQQEVLAFEEACINSDSANELKACFHEDYVGWGTGSPVPLTKSDILKLIDNDFATSDSESLLFKPLSVIVAGNMAVVSYIDAGKITNKQTDEVENYMQKWTDVCIKDGGRWYWISDHGTEVSTD